MTIFILFVSHINNRGRYHLHVMQKQHFCAALVPCMMNRGNSGQDYLVFLCAIKKKDLAGEDRHNDLAICRPRDDHAYHNADDGNDRKAPE